MSDGVNATWHDSLLPKLHLTPSIERGKDTTHQPDNQTMKPTEEQFTIIKQTYMDAETIAGGVDAAIAQWEAVRPKDDTDRWIPLSERRPTVEDVDEHGFVMSLHRNRVAWHTGLSEMTEHTTHWRRTNLPPKNLTPEEIEEQEIAEAWGGNETYPTEDFKAGWLACKSKGGRSET